MKFNPKLCAISTLLSAVLLVPSFLEATPPSPPANLRSVVLPAEVLLTWDASPDAAYYQVKRGEIDRRWVPLDNHLVTTRIRDTDFHSLPGYYMLTAVNAEGESTSLEFLVSKPDSSAGWFILGVNPRPVSDSSFAISWNLTAPADALLELGTTPTNYEWAVSNREFASRQEFIITGLAPTTTYYYRITSADSSGVGVTYSGDFATRPFTEPPPVEVPISPDDPPLTITSDEDTPVRFTLTADNPNGAALSYFIAQPPYSGSLLGTPPDLVFIPGAERSDMDTCQVGVTDGVETKVASIFFDVRSVHDAPIAQDRSVVINEDTGLKVQVSAFTFDADPSSLTYILVSGATNGVLNHGLWYLYPYEFEYLPNTNFNGIDHFTFAVSDGQSTGNVATVRIRVEPVPDRPATSNQTVTVSRTESTSFVIWASDPDQDVLSFTVTSNPRFGTLNASTPNISGEFFFTPAPGATNNTDSFSYTVSDGTYTASGAVTINLVPLYYPPVANGVSVSTESNQPVVIILSGSASNGAALSYTLTRMPAHGSLSGTAPNLTYTPVSGFVGVDNFTFKVSDGQAFSSDATVSISVLPPMPPAAPDGLTATTVSSTRIDLAWIDNSRNEEGFQVERSNDNRVWKLIATVASNARSYSNTGLAKNKLYYYRVRAFNNVGTSSYSSVASARTFK